MKVDMNKPLVSVLMTSYNRDKYIADAIQSVLASTFQDFELLVVDDGSTDATVEIARSYAARDARVKVHVNPKNLGDYYNRNHAASLAQGKYLKYLDSDDLLYPHGLEVMVSSMEAFPGAAFGVSRPQMNDRRYPVEVTPQEAYREHFLSGSALFADCPTLAIIATAAFRAKAGFSGKRFIGDTEMWLKLGASYPMVKMPQGLAWWRGHGSQEIAFGNSTFEYAKWNYTVALDALTALDCPLSTGEKNQAIRHLKHRHARHILHLSLLKRLPKVGLKVMRETDFSPLDLRRAFASKF